MDISSKELLQTIERIYKTSGKSKDLQEAANSIAQDCELIADFFSCTPFEAHILSLIIHDSIREKIITNNSLCTLLKMDFSEMAELVKTIRRLSRKNLVRSIKDRVHGVKYVLKPVVLESTFSAVKLNTVSNEKDVTFNFLSTVREESLKIFNNEITTFEILLYTKEILDDSKELPFVQWFNQQFLRIEDILLLINCCYEHIVESPEISLDLMLSLLFPDSYDKYIYKKQITNNRNPLFKNDLIKWQNETLNSSSDILLTEKTIANLLLNDVTPKKQQVNSKYFKIFPPENIKQETLIYNEAEGKEINILKNALGKLNYPGLIEKLKMNNFSGGLSILFHGKAGTGKTATVHQIAKETGRTLLYTDASTLKSMWLGESEKNVKNMFEDYRNICLQSDQHPILLFNEADAILSNRIQVNRSVDQTLNTLQNILLQELENFEGILIATTNLINNLDPAFERRFLYKVCFEIPSDHTVSLLLEQAFPEIGKEGINELTTYALTGANISNIQKKLLIKKTFENVEINSDEIKKLIDEEFYNKKIYKQIGFNKSLNN